MTPKPQPKSTLRKLTRPSTYTRGIYKVVNIAINNSPSTRTQSTHGLSTGLRITIPSLVARMATSMSPTLPVTYSDPSFLNQRERDSLQTFYDLRYDRKRTREDELAVELELEDVTRRYKRARMEVDIDSQDTQAFSQSSEGRVANEVTVRGKKIRIIKGRPSESTIAPIMLDEIRAPGIDASFSSNVKRHAPYGMTLRGHKFRVILPIGY
ncbi:hypothetical protein BJ165DRAFT_1563029 [Panaeolus papilionaceus]|nr:hypothetical protein BJ165DRAFT_1563029 [Panaeolus papilionaceus]